MTSQTDDHRNWKQEPLVWMVIAIPFSAVIMGICLIILAIQSDSGLVVDDYYRHGKEINLVLERDQAAYALGLHADLEINDFTEIKIRLEASKSFEQTEKIELQMIHATRPGLDRNLMLEIDDQFLVARTTPFTGRGRWNLYLQTASWRLTGSIQLPLQHSARLLPNYFEP